MQRKNLFLKVLAAALIIVMILGLSAVVYGTNTSADPLVTLSYINGTYKSNLLSEVNAAIGAKQTALLADLTKQISKLEESLNTPKSEPVINAYATEYLAAGKSRTVTPGTEILFLSGSATVDAAGLTDTTAGAALGATAALTENHLYVASGDCAIKATGDAKFLIK